MPTRGRIIILASSIATLAIAAEDGAKNGSAFPRFWVKGKWENDAVFKPDRYYTNGLYLEGVWQTLRPDYLPEHGDLFPKDAEYAHGLFIGQSMYTASDIALVEPAPDDRPYAGWGYIGWQLHHHSSGNNGTVDMQEWKLRVGVVGPASLADRAQDTFHDWIDDKRAAAWHTQMSDEPTVDLRWVRRLSLPLFEDVSDLPPLAIVPHVGLDVGTTFMQGLTGATLRAGDPLPGSDAGSGGIGPTRQKEGNKLELQDWLLSLLSLKNVFVGVEGRAVGHNTFLDGTWWNDSRSVDKEPWVAEASAGLEAHLLGLLNVRFSLAWRTDEFETQQHRHNFGSLSVWCVF